MPSFYRRVGSLGLGILFCLALVQCGDGGTTPDDNDDGPLIDQGVQALSHLEQSEAFQPRSLGDPATNTYDVGGRTYECSEQQFEVGAKFDENFSLNPTSDILWPGSIIDGATLATGDYVPILAARAPITISVSLENLGGAKSVTVEDPKLSTMREAIADLMTQEVTGATPAYVDFEITDVYSESQLDIALGVTYDNGLTAVKGQFDFSKTDILSRTVVKFLQVYYTIDVDIPQKPSDMFASSVTWPSLQAQISTGVSPVYISTISYGRMALFTIESTYSSTQVRAALDATMQAFNTSTQLSVEHSTVLAQSSIKAMIIGGSGAQAVQAVNGFDGLKQYMTTGGNYNSETAAAPLAYKLRYLSDNAAAQVVKAQDYVVKTCEQLIDGHYGIRNEGWYVAWFYVIYDLDGVEQRFLSDDITIGTSRSTDVPARATNVWVRVRYSTGVSNEDIFRYPASGGTYRPEVICWEVAGTTYNTSHSQIACDF